MQADGHRQVGPVVVTRGKSLGVMDRRTDTVASSRVARLPVAISLLLGPVMAYGFVVNTAKGNLGWDCRAYWLSGHHADLYGAAPKARDAYLYSPAFAQAIRPLTWLPWTAFAIVWLVLTTAALSWLLRPLGWAWGVPAFLVCVPALFIGNVDALYAVILVLGFRRPGLWCFPLLTKIAPGSVGLAWFAARREWRKLATALAWTAGIIAVSVIFTPVPWWQWFHFLARHRGAGDNAWALIHFIGAVVVFVIAVRTDRTWLLAPAMVLASPVLTSLSWIALLMAIPRLRLARTHGGSPAEAEGKFSDRSIAQAGEQLSR